MIDHKLDEITITKDVLDAVQPYNVVKGWESKDACVENFKDEIKPKLMRNQNGKCAFCGLPLADRNPEIEHIAPKGGERRTLHPECTFLPLNLVYACHHCNSTTCKGQIDTVESKSGDYRTWSFKLVHPYLDDPADFFEFDESGTIIPLPKQEFEADDSRRKKALFTIKLFGLDRESTLFELAKQIEAEKDTARIQARIKQISQYSGR